MKKSILSLVFLFNIGMIYAQTIKRIDEYGSVDFLKETFEIKTITTNTTELYYGSDSYEEMTYKELVLQIKAIEELINASKSLKDVDHKVTLILFPFDSGNLIIDYVTDSGWDEPNIEYKYGKAIEIIPTLTYTFPYRDFWHNGNLVRYKVKDLPRKIYNSHNLVQTYENLKLFKKVIDVFIKEKKIDREIVEL